MNNNLVEQFGVSIRRGDQSLWIGVGSVRMEIVNGFPVQLVLDGHATTVSRNGNGFRIDGGFMLNAGGMYMDNRGYIETVGVSSRNSTIIINNGDDICFRFSTEGIRLECLTNEPNSIVGDFAITADGEVSLIRFVGEY